MNSVLFFPKLTRRTHYKQTRKKTFYSNYDEYRQEIREDCLGRCVYCDCHENHIGGHQAMQLDHFRPKERPEFSHLINDPGNLLWSCSICNRRKWGYWHSQDITSSVDGEHGFIDPFIENRQEYFSVAKNGHLIPLKSPAKYMIELLGLNTYNRRQLREARAQSYELLPMIDEAISSIENKTLLTSDDMRLLTLLRETKIAHLNVLDFTLYP
jgi:hypothetical protein